MVITRAISLVPSMLICKPWSDRLLIKSATRVMVAVTSISIGLYVQLSALNVIAPSSQVIAPCAHGIIPSAYESRFANRDWDLWKIHFAQKGLCGHFLHPRKSYSPCHSNQLPLSYARCLFNAADGNGNHCPVNQQTCYPLQHACRGDLLGHDFLRLSTRLPPWLWLQPTCMQICQILL